MAKAMLEGWGRVMAAAARFPPMEFKPAEEEGLAVTAEAAHLERLEEPLPAR